MATTTTLPTVPSPAPTTLAELLSAHCTDLAPGTPALGGAALQALLALVPRWTVDGTAIVRRFKSADFHSNMMIVNAVASVAHAQNHHPDVAFGYNSCVVKFWTHTVGGLSINDFICAARLDTLIHA